MRRSDEYSPDDENQSSDEEAVLPPILVEDSSSSQNRASSSTQIQKCDTDPTSGLNQQPSQGEMLAKHLAGDSKRHQGSPNGELLSAVVHEGSSPSDVRSSPLELGEALRRSSKRSSSSSSRPENCYPKSLAFLGEPSHQADFEDPSVRHQGHVRRKSKVQNAIGAGETSESTKRWRESFRASVSNMSLGLPSGSSFLRSLTTKELAVEGELEAQLQKGPSEDLTGGKRTLFLARRIVGRTVKSIPVQMCVIVSIVFDCCVAILALATDVFEDKDELLGYIDIVVFCVLATDVFARLFAFGTVLLRSPLNVFEMLLVLILFVDIIASQLMNLPLSLLRMIRPALRIGRILRSLALTAIKGREYRRQLKHSTSVGMCRYMEDGFDLDLTYITPQIIAASVPTIGFETLLHNSVSELARLLNENHPNRYLLINLTEKRKYPLEPFFHRYVQFPIPQNSIAPLREMYRFCEDVEAFLAMDDANVVCVHSQHGRGRAGLMISALLLYQLRLKSHLRACSMFETQRLESMEHDNVDKPHSFDCASQVRFLQYFCQFCQQSRHQAIPRPAHLELLRVRFSGLPEAMMKSLHLQCFKSDLSNSSVEASHVFAEDGSTVLHEKLKTITDAGDASETVDDEHAHLTRDASLTEKRLKVLNALKLSNQQKQVEYGAPQQSGTPLFDTLHGQEQGIRTVKAEAYSHFTGAYLSQSRTLPIHWDFTENPPLLSGEVYFQVHCHAEHLKEATLAIQRSKEHRGNSTKDDKPSCYAKLLDCLFSIFQKFKGKKNGKADVQHEEETVQETDGMDPMVFSFWLYTSFIEQHSGASNLVNLVLQRFEMDRGIDSPALADYQSQFRVKLEFKVEDGMLGSGMSHMDVTAHGAYAKRMSLPDEGVEIKARDNRVSPPFSVNWINWCVERIWPYAEAAVREILKDWVEPAVRDLLPQSFKELFSIKKFSLGRKAPQLGPITASSRDHEGFEIQLDIWADWIGDVDITLAIGSSEIGISQIVLREVFCVKLKPILPELPIVAGVQMFFMNPPEFDLKFSGHLDFMNTNIIRDAVNDAIVNVVADKLVLPNMLVVDYSFETLWAEDYVCRWEDVLPRGILRLKVSEARDLPPSDFSFAGQATSDPYVVVQVGKIRQKTKTVFKNLNPYFNEHFDFLLNSLQQNFFLRVYDHDYLKHDDLLGTASCSPYDLLEASAEGMWVKLQMPDNLTKEGQNLHVYNPEVKVSLEIFELHTESDIFKSLTHETYAHVSNELRPEPVIESSPEIRCSMPRFNCGPCRPEKDLNLDGVRVGLVDVAAIDEYTPVDADVDESSLLPVQDLNANAAILIFQLVTGRVPTELAQPEQVLLRVTLGTATTTAKCQAKNPVLPWNFSEQMQSVVESLARQGRNHEEIADLVGEDPFKVRRIMDERLGWNLELPTRLNLLVTAKDLRSQHVKISIEIDGRSASTKIIHLENIFSEFNNHLRTALCFTAVEEPLQMPVCLPVCVPTGPELHEVSVESAPDAASKNGEAADEGSIRFTTNMNIDLEVELKLFALAKTSPEDVAALVEQRPAADFQRNPSKRSDSSGSPSKVRKNSKDYSEELKEQRNSSIEKQSSRESAVTFEDAIRQSRESDIPFDSIRSEQVPAISPSMASWSPPAGGVEPDATKDTFGRRTRKMASCTADSVGKTRQTLGRRKPSQYPRSLNFLSLDPMVSSPSVGSSSSSPKFSGMQRSNLQRSKTLEVKSQNNKVWGWTQIVFHLAWAPYLDLHGCRGIVLHSKGARGLVGQLVASLPFQLTITVAIILHQAFAVVGWVDSSQLNSGAYQVMGWLLVFLLALDLTLRVIWLGGAFFHSKMNLFEIFIAPLVLFEILFIQSYVPLSFLRLARPLLRLVIIVRIIGKGIQYRRLRQSRFFREKGFDLDAVYITEQVLVTSLPAVGYQVLFHNPVLEVARYLETQHKDKFLLVNLTEERRYPLDRFSYRYIHFPIKLVGVPALQDMWEFCHDISRFLSLDRSHVLCMHSRNGTGRVALMCAALLLFEKRFFAAASAIAFIEDCQARERVLREEDDSHHCLDNASQMRFLQYFAHCCTKAGASKGKGVTPTLPSILSSPKKAHLTKASIAGLDKIEGSSVRIKCFRHPFFHGRATSWRNRVLSADYTRQGRSTMSRKEVETSQKVAMDNALNELDPNGHFAVPQKGAPIFETEFVPVCTDKPGSKLKIPRNHGETSNELNHIKHTENSWDFSGQPHVLAGDVCFEVHLKPSVDADEQMMLSFWLHTSLLEDNQSRHNWQQHFSRRSVQDHRHNVTLGFHRLDVDVAAGVKLSNSFHIELFFEVTDSEIDAMVKEHVDCEGADNCSEDDRRINSEELLEEDSAEELLDEAAELLLIGESIETSAQEPIGWLNFCVEEVWPYAEAAVGRLLKMLVEPMLQEALPGPFKNTHFETFSLGKSVPVLGPLVAGASHHEGFEIQLNIWVAYDGDANIVIDTGMGAKIGISYISISGMLSVKLKPIIPTLPIVAGVQLYFLNPPNLDLTFTGQLEIANANVIREAVKTAIKKALLDYFVLPNMLVIDYTWETLEAWDGIVRIEDVLPQAVLRVTVMEATRLPAADFGIMRRTSDPYAVIGLGGESRKTEVIKKTLSPKWNESFDLLLHSAHQYLSVTVFDSDLTSRDDFLCDNPQIRAVNIIAAGDEGLWVNLRDGNGEEDPIAGPRIRLSAKLLRMTNYAKDLDLTPQKHVDSRSKTKDGARPRRNSKSKTTNQSQELPVAILVLKLVNGRVPPEIAEPEQVAIEVCLGSVKVQRNGAKKIVPDTVLSKKAVDTITALARKKYNYKDIAKMFEEKPDLVRRVSVAGLGYNLELPQRPCLLLYKSDLSLLENGKAPSITVAVKVEKKRIAEGSLTLEPLLASHDGHFQQEITLTSRGGNKCDLNLDLRLFTLNESDAEWVSHFCHETKNAQ